MNVEMLVLDSGEWVLAEEVAALPWRILVYRQRGARENELHIWLPGGGLRGSADLAFRRFWLADGVRWCVEVPDGAPGGGDRASTAATRIRFSSPQGRVLWALHRGPGGLGDLSDFTLERLLRASTPGLFAPP